MGLRGLTVGLEDGGDGRQGQLVGRARLVGVREGHQRRVEDGEGAADARACASKDAIMSSHSVSAQPCHRTPAAHGPGDLAVYRDMLADRDYVSTRIHASTAHRVAPMVLHQEHGAAQRGKLEGLFARHDLGQGQGYDQASQVSGVTHRSRPWRGRASGPLCWAARCRGRPWGWCSCQQPSAAAPRASSASWAPAGRTCSSGEQKLCSSPCDARCCGTAASLQHRRMRRLQAVSQA